MIAFVLGIVFSFWIYHVVKKNGGNPWGWIVGTVLIWPVFTFIVGIKYKSKGLTVVGLGGICLIAYAGIMLIAIILGN